MLTPLRVVSKWLYETHLCGLEAGIVVGRTLASLPSGRIGTNLVDISHSGVFPLDVWTVTLEWLQCLFSSHVLLSLSICRPKWRRRRLNPSYAPQVQNRQFCGADTVSGRRSKGGKRTIVIPLLNVPLSHGTTIRTMPAFRLGTPLSTFTTTSRSGSTSQTPRMTRHLTIQ